MSELVTPEVLTLHFLELLCYSSIKALSYAKWTNLIFTKWGMLGLAMPHTLALKYLRNSEDRLTLHMFTLAIHWRLMPSPWSNLWFVLEFQYKRWNWCKPRVNQLVNILSSPTRKNTSRRHKLMWENLVRYGKEKNNRLRVYLVAVSVATTCLKFWSLMAFHVLINTRLVCHFSTTPARRNINGNSWSS